MRTPLLLFLGSSVAVATGAQTMSATRPAKEAHHLEPLFELTLQYRPEMAAVVSSAGREGVLLGSGDGRIDGPRIRGSVKWSIFEVTGADRCKLNLAGVIATDDSASVEFDAQGFGVVADPRQPSRWHMNAAVKFSTDPEGPNAWLNWVLAVWDGRFDMQTGRHVYRAYAPAGASPD